MEGTTTRASRRDGSDGNMRCATVVPQAHHARTGARREAAPRTRDRPSVLRGPGIGNEPRLPTPVLNARQRIERGLPCTRASASARGPHLIHPAHESHSVTIRGAQPAAARGRGEPFTTRATRRAEGQSLRGSIARPVGPRHSAQGHLRRASRAWPRGTAQHHRPSLDLCTPASRGCEKPCRFGEARDLGFRGPRRRSSAGCRTATRTAKHNPSGNTDSRPEPAPASPRR